MSYSPPTITSAGMTIPSYSDCLGYLLDAFRSIYGSTSYLGTDSADYQDIAVRNISYQDALKTLQLVYLSLNPQTAIGASLDRIGRLIGTGRKSATYSTVTVTITGTAGTTIIGGIVKDVNGNYWNLASPVVIGPGGTVDVPATAQVPGAITADAGTITTIATPTAGWTAVTNAAPAATGQPIETDANYRARLLMSQAMPSITMSSSTAAAVAAVPGVTRSRLYENPTGSADISTNNPYGLPAHSITCIVEGGTLSDVAQAIYDKRGLGCYTNGTTTVNVADPNNGTITTPIRFSVLGYVYVYVAISVKALAGFTTATQSAISAAIVAYLNALGIGQPVVYGELYGAALTARDNPEEPTFSIQSISCGKTTAATTANLTSGNPNITVTDAAGIADGQVAVGAGIPAGATVSGVSGTTITLSANATETAAGAIVSFFTLGALDIAVDYNEAASGLATNVNVTVTT